MRQAVPFGVTVPPIKIGIDSGGAEHAQGNHSKENKAVPLVGWEGGIGSIEDGDEVVFKGLDGSFGWVESVITGRCKLVVEVVGDNGRDEEIRDFVVEALDDWMNARPLKVCKARLVALEKMLLLSANDGFGKDLRRL